MLEEDIKPNKKEYKFLNLAYNRFFELTDKISDENFWEKSSEIRLLYIKDLISIYTELLNYEPIQHFIEEIRKKRPPLETEISSDLLKFIRNIFVHFPVFNSWNEMYINLDLCTWNKNTGYIAKFIDKYKNNNVLKYRIWLHKEKKMVYIDINFPVLLNAEKIYLKDLIEEHNGTIFLIGVMSNVLKSQLMP